MRTITQSMSSLAARITLRLAGGTKLAVMTFHRVGGKYPIQTGQIRHHMELLARHFEVVSPSRLLRSPSGQPMAMITIDDSHRDIYQYIYPLALALKVPITICVPSDFFLRKQWLWFDQIAWLREHFLSGKEVEIGRRRLSLSDPHSVAELKRHIKRLLPDERSKLINRLAREADCMIPPEPVDGYEAVSETEMREMLASGLMEICAHGVTHTIATVLPEADLRRELNQCKRELEIFSDREIPCFCYPNGEDGDFDETTTRAVRDAGYRMALTSVHGGNDLRITDPFLIRRVHANSDTDAFERNISALGDIKRRLLKITGH